MTADQQMLPASQLSTGDCLLRLGGVGFAQFRDPDAAPVIVAEVRPPLSDDTSHLMVAPAEEGDSDAIVEIVTSVGTLYARENAPALLVRPVGVTPRTVLLISRRRTVHARLSEFGVPVARRAPIEADATADPVTAQEWATAPLIVIDGYLAVSTLRRMWARGDLPVRDQIVMVGTDPDDVRAEARQQAAHARMFALLPYDKGTLSNIFHTATSDTADQDPFLGILTPFAQP